MKNQPRGDFNPIFIVGAERSGTTLLAGLFDRHSRVAVPPETHFLYGVTPKIERQFRNRSHDELVDFLFSKERIQDMGLDRSRVLDRFRHYPPELSKVHRAALEEYAVLQNKTIIAEKSPHHLLYVPRILQWFPTAKVICIVRDGRDAVLSLLNVPWAHNNIWIHSVTWRRLFITGRRYQRRYPGRFTVVRFEDLLEDPERQLTRLLDFVGLHFEARQLDPSVRTGVVPEWEEQWKGKASQALDPSRIAAWKHTASQQQVWQMNAAMGNSLRDANYADPRLENCPMRTRLRLTMLAALYRIGYHPNVHPLGKFVKKILVKLKVLLPASGQTSRDRQE